MGRRSVMWEYFHQIEDGGVCMGCGRIVKRRGTSTKNFWDHIKHNHKALAKKLAKAAQEPRADAEEASFSDILSKKEQPFYPEADAAHGCTTERYSEENSVPFSVAALLKLKPEPEDELLTIQALLPELVPQTPVDRCQPRQSLSDGTQQQNAFIQLEPKPTFLNNSSQSDQTSRLNFTTCTSAWDNNQTEQPVYDDAPLHVQPVEVFEPPDSLNISNQSDRASQATAPSASVHRYEDCRDVLMERIYRECVAFSEAEDDSSRQQAVAWLQEDFKILKAFQRAV